MLHRNCWFMIGRMVVKRKLLLRISNELVIKQEKFDFRDFFNFCVINIDFDRFEKHDPKLKQWRLPKEWDWCEARMLFSANKDELMSYLNVPRFDLPELITPADDMKIFKDEWFNVSLQFCLTSKGFELILKF